MRVARLMWGFIFLASAAGYAYAAHHQINSVTTGTFARGSGVVILSEAAACVFAAAIYLFYLATKEDRK